MIRQMPLVMIALSIAATALCAGCQRPMGSATGPYAPAGSLSPTSNQPLIPFGSINGATRVPPPPTGSSQVSSGYDGQPAAMFSANQSYGNASGAAVGALASSGRLPSSASGARTPLGGMPVIDLTAGMMNSAPPPAIYDPAVQGIGGGIIGSSVAVGSGVATSGWQTGHNISVAPADLGSRLRPLDPSQAAALVPFPTAYDDAADFSAVAMAQYRTEANAAPARQAVQPTSAQGPATASAFEQRSGPGAYAAQLPAQPVPSTDPVDASRSVSPASESAASDALLWRNPAVAR